MQVRFPMPFGRFQRFPQNPILQPQGDAWEAKDLFNPTAIVRDGRVYLFYRAEDNTGLGQWNGTSRIGLAVSDDGLNFTRYPHPVLVPTEPYELPGGCEDPRIVWLEDKYIMTYTAFDGTTARLCLATSQELLNWRKHGVLFPGWQGTDHSEWSKSGAIVPERINGRFVMYFGDTDIWIAYSDDGVNWTPEKDPVMRRNPDAKAFDSLLIEPGPAPVVTDLGIILIYNAAQRVEDGPDRGKMRYAVGEVVFSKEDPTRVLYRSEQPVFVPETPDERSGQVDHVVFAEGLVRFNGKWLLYYGMGDSRVGAAWSADEATVCDGGNL